MPLINGQEYNWGKISIRIGGVEIQSISEMPKTLCICGSKLHEFEDNLFGCDNCKSIFGVKDLIQ